MKKVFLVLMTALMWSFATGCAPGKIHERSYLRAAAISGSQKKEVALVFFEEDERLNAEGGDMKSLMSNAELIRGRDIFTGYTELVIVDGMECRGLLAHMLNKWRISPSCMVVCCKDGKSLLEEYGAERLIGISEQAVKQGIAPESDIVTVLGQLCENGVAAAAELRPDGTVGSCLIT